MMTVGPSPAVIVSNPGAAPVTCRPQLHFSVVTGSPSWPSSGDRLGFCVLGLLHLAALGVLLQTEDAWSRG